jgi:hypothetical protein
MLDLAMAAAALRQPDERTIDALADQLVQALELPAAQLPRVRSHLLWAAVDSPSLNLVKRGMFSEPHEAREALGQFLVDLATQRGSVGPDQVSGLTRAYQALGLEPAAMFSLIHQRAAAPAAAPIEVRRPGISPRGEAIPPPPGDGGGGTADGTIVLNPAALAATLAASAESTALLGKIFADDDADAEADEMPIPASDPVAPGSLSGPYLALLDQLAGRDRWTHAEFVVLAARLDLLPNRALEVVNEAALDRAGDLVLVGDDVLVIDHEVLKELLE